VAGVRAEEAIAQKRVTEAFIQADPDYITLTRHERVRNDAGGWTVVDPYELTPQRFKLIHVGPPGDVTTADGEFSKPQYDQLVGKVGADIQRGDTFEYEDDSWLVVKVHTTEYEVLGNIERR
jgi:hypothetical protein